MRLALLAALFFLVAPAFGGEIWSAMVLATNPAPGQRATPPPAALAPYANRLTQTLNYQQFQILGSASKSLGKSDQERWLVPSPTFLLGAQAREENGGYRINLELFQEKRRLLQTEARLGMQSPLFISGPKYGDGQLVIVFEIRP